MQYAVFVYVSSAQAVIQDLFLFLFKTKDRERSEPNKPREKRAPYYGGKKNQQTKTCVLYIFQFRDLLPFNFKIFFTTHSYHIPTCPVHTLPQRMHSGNSLKINA